MCTGMEIVALLGTAASAAGGVMQNREASRNAQAMADARNQRLSATMMKNDTLAEQSRATFGERLAQTSPDAVAADQQKVTDTRQGQLESAVADAPAPEPALSGSAPAVVRSELARKLSDVLSQSKDQARRSATLGGYGDSWLNQGFNDMAAGRDIGQNANFAAGNLSILPYQQDIAEMRAAKPPSALGEILRAGGQMATAFAGSRAGAPGVTGEQALPRRGPIPPSRPMGYL